MSKYIVQMRRGTAAQWAAQDTIIPMEGEIVIEIDEENSLHKLKIGDGVHTYAELAYLMAGDEIVTQVLAEVKPRVVTVTLAETWTQDAEGQYSQVVSLDNITEHSRLDLQPDANMLAEFKQLGLVFTTENNGGVITVYSVGNMPLKAYTMQATVVETACDEQEAIIGAPVGTPVAQSDWEQTDDTKADYIKNRPELGALATKSEVTKDDLSAELQESLDNADATIPVATESALGGIKVGEFLEASEDGTLKVVPSYTIDGGETITETLHIDSSDFDMSTHPYYSKTYYLSRSVASISSWAITDDGDYVDSMELLVADDGGVYVLCYAFEDYNGDGNDVNVTYVSAPETRNLVESSSGGSADITRQVRVTEYATAMNVVKAVDNGNTITIIYEGTGSEVGIYLNGRTELFVGGYVYGYGSGEQFGTICNLAASVGASISSLSCYQQSSIGDGKIGIVINYV